MKHIAIIALISLAACTTGSHSSGSNSDSDGDRKSHAVIVSAENFRNQYHENEVAADEKFKDKDVLMVGNVTGITKGAFGGMKLDFGGNQLEGPWAELQESETAKAASLHKGDMCSVLCKGGTMVMNVAQVRECTIEPIPPPTKAPPTKAPPPPTKKHK